MTIIKPIDGCIQGYDVSPAEGLVYAFLATETGPPIVVQFDQDDLDELLRAGMKLRTATL